MWSAARLSRIVPVAVKVVLLDLRTIAAVTPHSFTLATISSNLAWAAEREESASAVARVAGTQDAGWVVDAVCPEETRGWPQHGSGWLIRSSKRLSEVDATRKTDSGVSKACRLVRRCDLQLREAESV